MASTYDIVAEQGSQLVVSLTYRNPAGVPIDLTGASAAMQVRRRSGAAEAFLRLSNTTSGISLGTTNGQIVITVTDEALSLVAPGEYVYDLEVNPSNGAVAKLISGKFVLVGEVTR
jgi:hypothetical protein